MTIAEQWVNEDSAKYTGLSVAEKAGKVVAERGETGQIIRVAWMMEIEKAIIAAIEEEREACARAAKDEEERARELQARRGNYGGDMFRAGITQGRAQAASLIKARIRARSTETKSPIESQSKPLSPDKND